MAASDVQVGLVDNEEELLVASEIPVKCFGHQIEDAIYRAMNPGWDTPEGVKAHAGRVAARWRSATRDRNGDLNTMFVKATVPHPEKPGERIIAGLAIWVQLSMVEGHGDKPTEDLSKAVDLEALYPGNPTQQRYLVQLDA